MSQTQPPAHESHEAHEAPDRPRGGIWHDLGLQLRIAAGVVGLFALIPLALLLIGEEGIPVWQRWVVVAVFTPMTIIIEWIVITGRTTIRK